MCQLWLQKFPGSIGWEMLLDYWTQIIGEALSALAPFLIGDYFTLPFDLYLVLSCQWVIVCLRVRYLKRVEEAMNEAKELAQGLFFIFFTIFFSLFANLIVPFLWLDFSFLYQPLSFLLILKLFVESPLGSQGLNWFNFSGP